VFGKHRPYRARDFAWFAQDAFEGWTAALTRAIRDAGSSTAITVGQDEGGLGERPNPLFHARGLDFTSMHTWWLNDHLLWDGGDGEGVAEAAPDQRDRHHAARAALRRGAARRRRDARGCSSASSRMRSPPARSA
jgi:hypothetical protein